MIAFAALTGPLPKVGVVVVALLAARHAARCASRRTRALAMLGALVLSPVLLLTDIWNSPQLRLVHRHPLFALVGAVLALAVLAAAAVRDRAPPGAAGAAGGAGAAVPGPDPGRRHHRRTCSCRCTWWSRRGRWPGSCRRCASRRPATRDTRPTHGRLRRLGDLGRAAAGALRRAVRAAGDLLADFEKALQQMVFFYVPFTLLYRLLRELRWTPAMIRSCLQLMVGAGADLLGDRVRRVRDQDDHPQPEAGRRQRPAHLLHGQLGVLRPRHLRPLPGAGDDPAGRAAALRPSASASRSQPSSCWRCSGRGWC